LVYYLNFYDLNLFLSIFFGVISYSLVLFLIKGVNIQEIKLLRSIILTKNSHGK
jgi:hypothetical protein